MLKTIITTILITFTLSLSAQRYISDTLIVGTQEDSIKWSYSLNTTNYIEVIKEESVVIVNNEYYLIADQFEQNDCNEMVLIKKTGSFANFVYTMEICDVENNLTNIIISNGNSHVLFVCFEISIGK